VKSGEGDRMRLLPARPSTRLLSPLWASYVRSEPKSRHAHSTSRCPLSAKKPGSDDGIVEVQITLVASPRFEPISLNLARNRGMFGIGGFEPPQPIQLRKTVAGRSLTLPPAFRRPRFWSFRQARCKGLGHPLDPRSRSLQ